MAPSPDAVIPLTPEQRRRLGAVYLLILNWSRDDNDQKMNLNRQPVQKSVPHDKPEIVIHSHDKRGLA